MRIGVIGVGSMGQNHARILADMGLLAGVSDIS
ncbi:MAG: gfo/Idh/MocA family oxidoreductase, partial [Thermoplasmata archaeon]|nr:gfo/Idh/MocA family oxidoreductase [Thermoplasmata archaeon]